MKFRINEKAIQFDNGLKINFEYKISKTLEKSGLLIVMLELNSKIYDNIYCIDLNKKHILWQINADKHRFRENSCFNNWENKKSYLKCWTTDGVLLNVNYKTGKILNSVFYK